MRIRSAVLTIAVLGGMLAAQPARAADPVVLMSNFRFCAERPFPCDPLDLGYLPDPTTGAPVAPVYNPVVVINVEPGTTLTFRYEDPICDAIAGCPGHTVQIVGGPPAPTAVKGTGTTISVTVPEDAVAGSDLPYFCPVGGSHFVFGMTGVLHVT